MEDFYIFKESLESLDLLNPSKPYEWSAVAQMVDHYTGDQRVASSRHHCRSNCVVSLSKTLYPLLSTGSAQEELS